jgi:quercetin dioxygenase-like cupin family protein
MGTAGPAREVAIARPDDPALTHLAVVGDTYTVLLSGDQTDGRFAMLDMLIPPAGGPPPHFHDFEECFRVLEGSIEVRVGDAPPVVLGQGDSANIPANAPHSFRNAEEVEARLLCTVVPSGSRGSSPSSATPSPPAPHPPRSSAAPSASSGCASPWPRLRSAAWGSCRRPQVRRASPDRDATRRTEPPNDTE